MTKKLKNIISAKSKVTASIPKSVSFFDTLNNKTIYIVVFITTLLAFLLFKDFILSRKVYLFRDIGSDTLNANLPYLELILRYFKEHGTLSWSFSNGMGQSIFPLFLRDPFDLLTLTGSANKIYYLLGLKEFLKIIVIAVLFYFYLGKLNLNNFTKLVGSLLISFCGFMIVGGGWYAFSYEAVNFVLLLLGFELLFQDNRGIIFSAGTLLFAASMPFNLYIYGVFIALYAFLRYYSTTNEFKLKGVLILYGKMLLFGLIGICLAGPLFLENVNQILESPRGSGENSYFDLLANMPMFALSDKVEFGTSVMRFFSSDIIGTGNNFRGWGNTLEAPLFYCGIPCLLLLPQLFGFLNKKKKIIFGLFLAFWCIPIFLPYFRRAFWLFSGDYYRSYSFFVSICFLIYSLMALDFIIKNRKINLIVLGVTLIALYILISYPYFGDKSVMVASTGAFVKIFIALYALVFVMLAKSKDSTVPLVILLFLICTELFYLSNISINKRESVRVSELNQKIGYNDYTVEASDFLRSTDHSFYRVDKYYYSTLAMHGSLNDAMIQNYYGTTTYNGFAEKSYIDYLKNFNIISQTNENEARWARGLNNRGILESINSVKYLFVKSVANPAWQVTHDSIAQFGDVKVLKSKRCLPLGFCYDKFVKQSDFEKLSTFQKDYVSLNALVMDDADVSANKILNPFNLSDTIPSSNFNWDVYSSLVSKLNKDTFNISSFKENEIKGTINLDSSKIMYLSIPLNKGWNIQVNGNNVKPIVVAKGMMGVPLSKGKNVVELTFKHLYIFKGIILSIGALIILITAVLISRKRFSI